jgi:hypothetical protein
MWILQFLPNWIFYYILFGAGIGLLIAKFLPKYYKEIVGTTSAITFAFGLFMVGAISNEEVWQARVKEMEAKVAEAEVQSAKENIKLVEKVVTKTQIVKQKGQDIVKYIDKEIVKYDTKFLPGGQCEIPKEFIEAHNRAATK